MKLTKKILCIFIILLMFAGIVYAQNSVRVYVNGTRVNTDGMLHNELTYVPLRVVSEALGATVDWDGSTRSAYVTFNEDDMIPKLVENISPSVVTIIGNYISDSASSKYNNPTVHGSGVIYKSNGHIITNAHVVKDTKNLTVVLSDGTTLPAKVLFEDEKSDLAIVKVEKLGLKAISMADSASVISGKTAIAMGTPISLSMRNSVTKGIVSGTDVSLADSYYKLIQTDTTINPGNSGGPLLNIKGELIGINSSKYSGIGIDNMAFAIPVDTVKYAIQQYEQNGKILRPDTNFVLDQSWEASIGLPTEKGITVKSSQIPELIQGDIIIKVNDINVHSITDWNEAIKDTYNGKTLNIIYTRNEVQNTVEITA